MSFSLLVLNTCFQYVYILVTISHSFTSPFCQVKWKDAFEPYVVLPTLDAPDYDERLLERMGDKIAYGLHLYAKGSVKRNARVYY